VYSGLGKIAHKGWDEIGDHATYCEIMDRLEALVGELEQKA
jgi:hypothetical protein